MRVRQSNYSHNSVVSRFECAGDPTLFSHISHLLQVQCAIGVAVVKCCGAQCSEYDATSACFSVVQALVLARNREEKRQGMGRVKL